MVSLDACKLVSWYKLSIVNVMKVGLNILNWRAAKHAFVDPAHWTDSSLIISSACIAMATWQI